MSGRVVRRLAAVWLSAVLLMGLLPVVNPALASGTTFVVTTTADTNDASQGDGVCDDGTGECSLRAAVEEANALAEPVDITLPAGGYQPGSTVLVSGDVTILGAGAGSTALTSGGAVNEPLFELAGGALNLHDVAFTDTLGAALVDVRGPQASVRLADIVANDVKNIAVFAGDASSGVTIEVVRSMFINVEYGIFLADAVDQTLDVRDSSFQGGRNALFIVAGAGVHVMVSDTQSHATRRAGIEFYRSEDLPFEGTATLEVLRSSFTGSLEGHGIRVEHPWGQQQSRISTRIVESELSDNTAYGVEAGGELVIERSTIARNLSGALDHAVGPVTIIDSTITDNEWMGANFFGDHPAPLEIVNTTFSGNQNLALSVGRNNAVLRNVTITDTQPDDGEWSVGLIAQADGLIVENSVIADNGSSDCYPGLAFTSGGYNADSDGTCSFNQPTDQQGVDPLLGPLADNGGSTLTHMPLAGSPLIDAGSNDICPATDQRGMTRPVDGTGDGQAICDIGAVEAGAGSGPTEPVSGSLAGTVAVTFDTAGPCLIVHATSVDFGTHPFNDGMGGLAPGTVNGTGDSEFSIENCSEGEIELLARGTDAQSRTSDAAWSLTAAADSCAPGPDHYGLADSGPTGITPLTLLDQSVGLLTGGALRLTELSIQMPCVGSAGAGETFDLTVFFTAVLP